MDKWIPVNERLPKRSNKCIVAWRISDKTLIDIVPCIVSCGYEDRSNIRHQWILPGGTGEVTHWMPLPDMPEDDA